MKKVTMQSIANDLGISKMTVSRYFNGGYISEKTKKQIEEYVIEKNYRPNFLAQNLKSESSIIGIVAPKIDNHVFNEMVKGFIDVADENNIQLLYFSTNYNSEKEDDAINSLISMNVKGIIVDSNSVTIKKKYLYNVDNLISFGLKSDFKNNVFFPELDALRSILPMDKSISLKFIYKEYMLSTRTNIARDLFSEIEYSSEIIEISDLKDIQPNSLYICSTDSIAYDLYRLISKTNYSIGKDVFIVGIGGNEINDLLHPSLVSIHFPYRNIATEMMNMIVCNNYISYCSTFDIINGDSYPQFMYKKGDED